MHCLHGCLRCIVLSHAQLVTDIPFWFPFFLFFFVCVCGGGGGRCNITSVFPRYTGNEGVFFFLVSGNGNQTRCTCDVDRGICGVAETNHSTTSPAILMGTIGSEFILDTVEALGLTMTNISLSPPCPIGLSVKLISGSSACLFNLRGKIRKARWSHFYLFAVWVRVDSPRPSVASYPSCQTCRQHSGYERLTRYLQSMY